MIWLLDLIEDHRAAVKYDLLAHGYRLEWLATSRLPWGDALAIIQMQPPSRSAVYRELHPDEYDRDKVVDRLETLAVLMLRGQLQLGNQTEVADADLPHKWDDLFEKEADVTADQLADQMARMNELLGWTDNN